MLEADRQKHKGADGKAAFEETRAEFEVCLATLAAKFADAASRHGLDIEGDDFISRVAQRYGLGRTEDKAAPTAKTKPVAKTPAAKPAAKKATATKKKVTASADDVE